MNRKQTIILIMALVVSAFIVWYDLPIEFPGIIAKVFMLFMKIAVVWALAVVACIFAAGKKKA
ncbi:MAG: hypothetical protein A4E65_01228 [Syntrophorhabdus sp. PtaU1.Bin153]|nr:MAG: hypothetical protein A4E65_01228 [Syntrophorhabdus sp. PtaU1.Bin153]